MDDFCKLLKEKRVEKGLTKREVANIFGITPMYYMRFENGDLKPTKRNIKEYARFLELDEEELLQIIQNDKLKGLKGR